jgi:hypothetical protein
MADHSHDIEKYLKGELTPAERHALEKKALSDPFLADALEGAEQIEVSAFSNDVRDLTQKIGDQKEKSLWTWSLRIAAGLAFVIASTYIVWQTIQPEHESKELAHEKNQPVIPEPVVADSIAPEKLSQYEEEKPTAGPAIKDEQLASKQTVQPKIKVELKKEGTLAMQPETSGPPVKDDASGYISDKTVVEESRTEEIRVTEPIAQAKPVEKEVDAKAAYKSEGTQRAKKLSSSGADQQRTLAPTSTSQLEDKVTSNSKTIRGKVTSAEDGSGLPGVNVIIKGSTIGTVTDEAGNYKIEVGHSNPVLVYSFIGLQSKELSPTDRTEINVSMELDATQLSEVVVTAMGIQREAKSLGYAVTDSQENTTLDLAHPSTGYRSFKQYL